jgi:hypothetical protein
LEAAKDMPRWRGLKDVNRLLLLLLVPRSGKHFEYTSGGPLLEKLLHRKYSTQEQEARSAVQEELLGFPSIVSWCSRSNDVWFFMTLFCVEMEHIRCDVGVKLSSVSFCDVGILWKCRRHLFVSSGVNEKTFEAYFPPHSGYLCPAVIK